MVSNRFKFGNAIFYIESQVDLVLSERLSRFTYDADQQDYYVCVEEERDKRRVASDEYFWYIRNGNRFHLTLNTRKAEQYSYEQILIMIPFAQLLLEKQGTILHSAYVLHDNQAILFSGSSGIGKSTQADLWVKYRGAEIINGDRSILYIDGDTVMAGGYHYSGTSGISYNKRVPVKAIVLLEQGMVNAVETLSPIKVFEKVLSQCTYNIRDKEEVELVTSLIIDIMSHTKILNYSCKKDVSAVIELEKYL